MNNHKVFGSVIAFAMVGCTTTNFSGTERGTADTYANFSGTERGSVDAYTNYAGNPAGDDVYQNHRNPWPGQSTIAHTNYSGTTPVRAPEAAPAPDTTPAIAVAADLRTQHESTLGIQKPVRIAGRRIHFNERIVFESWSSELAPKSHAILDQIAAIMKHNDHVLQVEVQGHTARTGQKDAMYDLSARRAKAVRAYLIAADVDPSRLIATGFGEDRPHGATHSEHDRRVEFHITKQREVAFK